MNMLPIEMFSGQALGEAPAGAKNELVQKLVRDVRDIPSHTIVQVTKTDKAFLVSFGTNHVLFMIYFARQNRIIDQVDWDVEKTLSQWWRCKFDKNKQCCVTLNLFRMGMKTVTCLPSGLRKLYCSCNELEALPDPLPPNLRLLHCSENRLTRLPQLPPSLTYLYCAHNNLTSLPDLPPKLIVLACSNNNLTTLPDLPPSLTYLYCKNNKLTSLPGLPPNLFVSECSHNRLESQLEQ